MYFINEKAGTMAINGNYVNFEKGLPALYRAQNANPERKIIIWRDVYGNTHVETTYNDAAKIIDSIKKFEKGEKYWS